MVPYLNTHPDQTFTAFLKHGLPQVFQIGFDRSTCSPRPHKGNFQLDMDNPAVVICYVVEEVAAERLEV